MGDVKAVQTDLEQCMVVAYAAGMSTQQVLDCWNRSSDATVSPGSRLWLTLLSAVRKRDRSHQVIITKGMFDRVLKDRNYWKGRAQHLGGLQDQHDLIDSLSARLAEAEQSNADYIHDFNRSWERVQELIPAMEKLLNVLAVNPYFAGGRLVGMRPVYMQAKKALEKAKGI